MKGLSALPGWRRDSAAFTAPLATPTQDMVLGIYFLSGFLCLPAWTALARRTGKKAAWLTAMAVSASIVSGRVVATEDGVGDLLVAVLDVLPAEPLVDEPAVAARPGVRCGK